MTDSPIDLRALLVEREEFEGSMVSKLREGLAQGGQQVKNLRDINETLNKRLAVAVTTRNVAAYRDPAVILIDQLKQIYIDGTLNAIDTTQWYPTVMRKEYALAFTVTETGLDDPDQMFYENYMCGSERNYTGFCNPEVDKLINQQSVEPNVEKRRQIVWQIERYLAEDGGRPIIFHPRSVTCSWPQVKGITVGVNSPYNEWRIEDAWLDR